MDIAKCGYFCTPPNVATFGVPIDITKINVYSTKCGNVNVWKCFEQCVGFLPHFFSFKIKLLKYLHYNTNDSIKGG